MEEFDVVESWVDSVGISHSNSKRTSQIYKSDFKRFCNFLEKTPDQILQEYENSEERTFRRQYAQYIQAYISSMRKREFSPNTISSKVAVIKSFFKYNDLPLGHVITVRQRVIFHNRDITHEEIKLILNASRPRERAFFTIMAQSGLRPDTICNLKYKHIREDFENNKIPCRIDVLQEITKGKYHPYFTFIGEDAVKFLKSHLSIRPNILEEDYLFVKQGTDQKLSPKSMSNFFGRTLQKLQEKGLLTVKQKQANRPHDIRLYNLRKWFRKHSHQAGFELVQFWMGHIVKAGLEEHYRPTDVEFHREIYAEKAMPFLRLEKATPTETEKTIGELKDQLSERDQEIRTMKNQLKKLAPLLDFANSFENPDTLAWFLDQLKGDLVIKHMAIKSDEKSRRLNKGRNKGT